MIRVNAERLWATLEMMAQIGGTPAGGVTRLALSEETGSHAICCATGRWTPVLPVMWTAWATCLSAAPGKTGLWLR
jgi:hypothetical protein